MEICSRNVEINALTLVMKTYIQYLRDLGPVPSSRVNSPVS